MALWACHPATRVALGRAVRWRGLRADITGDDLVAAGFGPAQDFGEALRTALAVKLDHDADRERQLQMAVAVLSRLRRRQCPTRRGGL